jgi:hypothetical protein
MEKRRKKMTDMEPIEDLAWALADHVCRRGLADLPVTLRDALRPRSDEAARAATQIVRDPDAVPNASDPPRRFVGGN